MQDSLGGNAKTTLIVTIGPSSEHLQETINTLQAPPPAPWQCMPAVR